VTFRFSCRVFVKDASSTQLTVKYFDSFGSSRDYIVTRNVLTEKTIERAKPVGKGKGSAL